MRILVWCEVCSKLRKRILFTAEKGKMKLELARQDLQADQRKQKRKVLNEVLKLKKKT